METAHSRPEGTSPAGRSPAVETVLGYDLLNNPPAMFFTESIRPAVPEGLLPAPCETIVSSVLRDALGEFAFDLFENEADDLLRHLGR